MRAIVAVDEKWGIGKNNDLLFNLPLDMAFFREKTLNKVEVMGGNTLDSFPNKNPLKNRINIVLSKSRPKRADCAIVSSLEELRKELKKYNTQDIFVIGGARFYSTMLEYCEEILITKVFADGNADVFFPNLDKNENFVCVYSSEEKETNGFNIKFTTYKNLKVKEF